MDKDILRSYLEHLMRKKVTYQTICYQFSSINSFYEWLLYEDKSRATRCNRFVSDI